MYQWLITNMQETNEMTDSLNKERESVRKQVEKLFFFFLRKDKLFISVYKSTIYMLIWLMSICPPRLWALRGLSFIWSVCWGDGSPLHQVPITQYKWVCCLWVFSSPVSHEDQDLMARGCLEIGSWGTKHLLLFFLWQWSSFPQFFLLWYKIHIKSIILTIFKCMV